MIHSTADVQAKNVGLDTYIWQFTVVLGRAKIGSNCNINCHVFIENDVIIGDNVTIKSGVQLWDGLRVMDDVFIGPNVTFTNDERPRSKQYPERFQQTVIEEKASIGAGAVILGGVIIGKYSMVGAGAIVTKDVPERALIVGNPGRIVGWLNKDGSKMKSNEGEYVDDEGNKWKDKNGVLIKR